MAEKPKTESKKTTRVEEAQPLSEGQKANEYGSEYVDYADFESPEDDGPDDDFDKDRESAGSADPAKTK